jgi:transposase
VRATTGFKRLMDLPGDTVTDVDFQPAEVVVTVRLRRSKLSCPACGFTTRARYDTHPVSTAWRHLDLGRWRLEVRADLRRIDCPTHGARTEGVPSPGPVPGSPVTSRIWSGGWRPPWTRRPLAAGGGVGGPAAKPPVASVSSCWYCASAAAQ